METEYGCSKTSVLTLSRKEERDVATSGDLGPSVLSPRRVGGHGGVVLRASCTGSDLSLSSRLCFWEHQVEV